MELSSYQAEAWRYDQHPTEPARALTVALLGLGGEVGTLQTNQKKLVRDGVRVSDYDASVVEDLGDILWYVSDAATWLGVSLDEVARTNLAKIAGRWLPHPLPLPGRAHPEPQIVVPDSTQILSTPAPDFDADYPDGERFPRQLRIDIGPVESPSGTERVMPVWQGRPVGDMVSDNSYIDDGYRFHDAIHLGYLTVLGWSPVIRSLMKRKRKSDPKVDEVDDGGRAVVIEEGLTAFIFEAATRTQFFESSRHVDTEILTICRRLTAGFEVARCTALEWEQAILQGYSAWRFLRANGSAAISCDLNTRRMEMRKLTEAELQAHKSAWAGKLS